MAMSNTSIKPLVARSSDGSLIGIHPPREQSSSTSQSGLVRCYDGNVSNGALKFTLRFPLLASPSTRASDDDGVIISSTSSAESRNGLRKLVFASNDDDVDDDAGRAGGKSAPSYLCGMCQSSSIHIWDLERGVLSQTFDARSSSSSSSSAIAASASSKKKKKHRKSSLNDDDGNEILCDIITAGNNQLYALMFFPDGDGNGGGKCRVYQYNLTSSGATLVKKIKVGSVRTAPSSAILSNDAAASPSSSSSLLFAIAITKTTMIIRMESSIRIFDVTTGEKLCKMDTPADVSSSTAGDQREATTSFAPLVCTPDGRYIVCAAGLNNQAVLLHYKRDGNDNHHNILHTMALLSTKADSPITDLDIFVTADGEKILGVLAFQQSGIASLFAVSISSSVASSSSSSSSLVPQMPKAQLLTSENDSSVCLVGAGFSSRKHNESLLLLFQQVRKAGGSAAGSGTTLPMESVPDALESLEGTVIVGTSLLTSNDAKTKDGKKRKAAGAASSVALAPGDQGRETLLAVDLAQGTKKSRVARGEDDDDDDLVDAVTEENDAEDEFDDDLDADGEQKQSIAERLALLSSAMEQTDDEDDDVDDEEETDDREKHNADDSYKSKHKLKSATSDTLTSLLTQALSSNDSTQLNISLQVTDRRVVEGTVRSLQALDAERSRRRITDDSDAVQTRYIPTLMAHIVRRMARRHSLVMPLGVWIKAILAATARSSTNQAVYAHDDDDDAAAYDQIMAKEGRDMARALGPLKNFLNERVECFPQILKLDGRLALLNQQL